MENYLLGFISVLLSCLSFFLVRVFLKVERNSDLFIRMDTNLQNFTETIDLMRKDIIELKTLQVEVKLLQNRVQNLKLALSRKKNGVGNCPDAN